MLKVVTGELCVDESDFITLLTFIQANLKLICTDLCEKIILSNQKSPFLSYSIFLRKI